MKQEIQVSFTLEVDTNQSKVDIERYVKQMEMSHTRASSSRNRWEYGEIKNIKIREEAEIYGNG